MAKEKVPVITEEEVAKCDAEATARAMSNYPTTAEAELKPKKASRK